MHRGQAWYLSAPGHASRHGNALEARVRCRRCIQSSTHTQGVFRADRAGAASFTAARLEPRRKT
ncbi:MAG TPA: hypothetical protein VLM41_04170, partial [Steroidobacteraceae bacterium]|nr:hypothetical protein [Steroidobacteraceae bacterium]